MSHRQDTNKGLKKAAHQKIFASSSRGLDVSQREFKRALQAPADVENLGKSTQLPTPCAIFDSNRLLTERPASD
jgi:hypothetical protein